MGTSSGANFNQQQPPILIPPHQQTQRQQQQHHPTGISISSGNIHPSTHMPVAQIMGSGIHPSNSDQAANDSQTESASSHETWPIDSNHADQNLVKKVEKEGENEYNASTDQQVIRRISPAEKLSLREVAKERIEVIADRMAILPDELLDELKNDLRAILEGTGGSQNRDEFLRLQNLLQGRSDLNVKTLMRAHRVQLEIIVAINTGIQAFLHPNISLSQDRLIEVFAYKRCRNIACQNALPADECGCDICSSKNGFCNLCMCVVCFKFDFEVNTCRWIGCDLCSHWTHTDCAIRVGKIGMGISSKNASSSSPEMLFRCQACNRTSELLGWVKDVFQHCAPGWDRESLVREFDFVSRIFRGSEDPRGKKLLWKCEDLLEKMKNGLTEATACRIMLAFFQDLDISDFLKNIDGDEGVASRLIAPHEACARIAEVVQEALRKMEVVAEEKMRSAKRARQAVDACDRELADKAREVAELKIERQRKRQQVEELDSIKRLKQAEAEMFQKKATEARFEAEKLQSIMIPKTEQAEKEYANRYLKARLEEAEMEKQYLYENIRLQESQKQQQQQPIHGSSMMMSKKIQDLINKNVYTALPPSSMAPAGSK